MLCILVWTWTSVCQKALVCSPCWFPRCKCSYVANCWLLQVLCRWAWSWEAAAPWVQWARACWLQVPTHSSPSLPCPHSLCGGREGSSCAGASAATRRGEGSTTAMGWFCRTWPQWLPLRQPRQTPGRQFLLQSLFPGSKVPLTHRPILRVRSAPGLTLHLTHIT